MWNAQDGEFWFASDRTLKELWTMKVVLLQKHHYKNCNKLADGLFSFFSRRLVPIEDECICECGPSLEEVWKEVCAQQWIEHKPQFPLSAGRSICPCGWVVSTTWRRWVLAAAAAAGHHHGLCRRPVTWWCRHVTSCPAGWSTNADRKWKRMHRAWASLPPNSPHWARQAVCDLIYYIGHASASVQECIWNPPWGTRGWTPVSIHTQEGLEVNHQMTAMEAFGEPWLAPL